MKDDMVFDWGLYGMLIRKRRIDIGYKKAEFFAKSIWRRARVAISRDTLYKIEQGRQIPDALQFMGINMALYGVPFSEEVMQLCMSNEWKEIESASRHYIPTLWKQENFNEAEEELSKKFDGGFDECRVAHFCNEERWLFENPIPF